MGKHDDVLKAFQEHMKPAGRSAESNLQFFLKMNNMKESDIDPKAMHNMRKTWYASWAQCMLLHSLLMQEGQDSFEKGMESLRQEQAKYDASVVFYKLKDEN